MLDSNEPARESSTQSSPETPFGSLLDDVNGLLSGTAQILRESPRLQEGLEVGAALAGGVALVALAIRYSPLRAASVASFESSVECRIGESTADSLEQIAESAPERFDIWKAGAKSGFRPEDELTDMPHVDTSGFRERILRSIGMPVDEPGPGTITILHPRLRLPEKQLLANTDKVEGLYGTDKLGYGFYQRTPLPSNRSYLKNADSVVQIFDRPGGGSRPSAGSGVVIDAKGLILTAEHVVREGGAVSAQTLDGTELSARVLATDVDSDLALLQVTPSPGLQLKAATISALDSVSLSSRVALVGHPLALKGLYASLGRFADRAIIQSGEKQLDRLFFPINSGARGYSGGPIFNNNGEVVSITSHVFDKVKFPSGKIGLNVFAGSPPSKINAFLNRVETAQLSNR